MQSARSFDAARLAGAVPWLLLAALAAALAFQDIRSLDYWWHLRTGQLIAETGAVPRVDPYTFTVPGARWIDIHWLHQLGLWGLYQAGGHAAVVLASGAAVLLLLALLAPIGYRRERALVSVGVLALMLLCIAGRLQPRPEIPTFLLLAGVLRLLHRFERTGDAKVLRRRGGGFGHRAAHTEGARQGDQAQGVQVEHRS